MEKMKLGKTKIDISKIGLGTWAIGGGPAWGGDRDLQGCIDTIRECPKLGVNLIDTAPAYNFGNSEKIVGQALAGMKREEVVLTTKCGIVWTREGSLFNKVGDVQLYKNLSKESIREEIEMSLERLGTNYVDVYMTHWQSVEPCFTPISETMEALNELKAEGKILAIGASNISPEQIREYVKYGELDIVQGKYSILDRKIEDELLPTCKEHGITLQAYSPLEQGLLSGKITREHVARGAQVGKKWFERENMFKAITMMEGWKELCQKYECTIGNLALAWVIAQGEYINILSGASNVEQIKQNVRSAEIKLSQTDVQMMREMAEAIDN